MNRIAFAFAILAALPAIAHSHYGGWRTATGGSCCNDQDCRPVPYEIRADGLWLKIGADWWRANPAEAREQQPVDSDAHACVLLGAAKPHCYAPPWSAS